MVWCCICSTGIATAFSCNVLGSTHVKIGMSAYLLNDSYKSNKNKYSNEESFAVFCSDCFKLGHYHAKII
jgi:hypothetical protein